MKKVKLISAILSILLFSTMCSTVSNASIYEEMYIPSEIVETMKQNEKTYISDEDLEYKYKNEIHANELVLLAYYIAAINIEETYHTLSRKEEYTPFEGIVLTDTFQLAETKDTIIDINM